MMVRGLVAAVSIAIAAALPAAAQSKLDTAMSFAETAAALSKEGDFAGAVKLYLKAYDLSREPVLLYNAARALDKKGDLRDARAMYERYLAAESDAAGIARGREKLRDLLERMPGSLRIETDPPGATLVLDGRPAGTSPATVPDLRPGPHEVVARLAGYEPTVARVEVQPDAESRATVALEPAPVDLTVRCDCPGARVEVDGTPVGTGPLARAVPVRPGRHVVTVWSAAGEGRSRQVEVPVGRAVRVEVEAAGGPPSPPTPSPATLPPPSPPVRAAAQTPAPAETVSARAERRGPTPWTWVTIGLGSAMVVTGGVPRTSRRRTGRRCPTRSAAATARSPGSRGRPRWTRRLRRT
ncbi:MAG: PEGA domain-containing protein [Deltaproteobacteria bacterium]|nr:PEGA domain-containing protein [Deltaproteobacteria bacterium]